MSTAPERTAPERTAPERTAPEGTAPEGTAPEPRVVVLDEVGSDERGVSFSMPTGLLDFLGAAGDTHVASIEPGCVRGDHYHVERRELILVLPHEQWSFHWDLGEGTEARARHFHEQSAVAIAIQPNCSHAIRNDGRSPLWLIASTDGRYDPERPDAYRRVVAGGSA